MANVNAMPVWSGADYPRVPPGKYSAVAVRVQGPDWVRSFQRWSLIVEFELLGDAAQVRVCAFFNMGSDRDRPLPKRQSRYFNAWTIANGELPRKGQAMDPKLFLDGQVYEIEVEYCRKDSEDNLKSDAELYSKVGKILKASFPNQGIRNQSISNQESTNHPIKQSTNQVGKRRKIRW